MYKYNDPYLDNELSGLVKEAKSKETRKRWGKIATSEGMISALGEYTPVEFVALLEYIDELESKLSKALCGEGK